MRTPRQPICVPLVEQVLALLALVPLAQAVFTTSACAAQCEAAKPLVSAVASVGITVEDLDRSVEFYSSVLSFTKIRELELIPVALDLNRALPRSITERHEEFGITSE